MAGNNMRASFIKDLYSGKYPELRGRVELIGDICGHFPATALTISYRWPIRSIIQFLQQQSADDV